jgi:hypothetical protein
MLGDEYLENARAELQKLKEQADGAIAQVPPGRLFEALDPESNGIAIIMKHVAGNMRSRWTDFLVSDGEKADRRRDTEFEAEESDTEESIRARWEAGWRTLFDALAPLTADDLGRTVLIRGERHSVLEAVQRQLTHYAGHVGQIVFLAKHLAGSRWRTLSIPRGKSEEFNRSAGGGRKGPGGRAESPY